MLRFPLQAFRENRIILSKEELREKSIEYDAIGKSLEVGLYSFTKWINNQPQIESVIIDKIVLIGNPDALEIIAKKKFGEGIESILIFDGKDHLLLLNEERETLEELQQEKYDEVKVVTDVLKKITLPNYPNLRTGQMSKIVWRMRLK